MGDGARLGVAGLLFSGTIALGAAPAMAAGHHTWVVQPGVGTISAAVAAASPGDTLQLEEGTFYDSVFVGQLDAQGNALPKPLTIHGEGDATVIKPPATSTNPCNGPGAMEGLCVVGQLDSQGNPVLSNPVRHVHISDLRTTGFSIRESSASTRSDSRSETSAPTTTAAMASPGSTRRDRCSPTTGVLQRRGGPYVGDSPTPTASSGTIGRITTGSVSSCVTAPTSSPRTTSPGATVGILAINTGQGATGASGAGQYLIEDNTVTANDQACPSTGGPPTSGIGIALAGVQGVKVLDNEVNNNKPSGPSVSSGGVVIATAGHPASPPTNNLVKDNNLDGNRPPTSSGTRPAPATRSPTMTATPRSLALSDGAPATKPRPNPQRPSSGSLMRPTATAQDPGLPQPHPRVAQTQQRCGRAWVPIKRPNHPYYHCFKRR